MKENTQTLKELLENLESWGAIVKIRYDGQTFDGIKRKVLTKDLSKKITGDVNIVEIQIEIPL